MAWTTCYFELSGAHLIQLRIKFRSLTAIDLTYPTTINQESKQAYHLFYFPRALASLARQYLMQNVSVLQGKLSTH